LRSTESHLIPLVLKAASGHSRAVSIFGNDYETPDGTCIRDYIHVNDLASAHISALNLLINQGESDVFNLGTGTGFSVLEVISAAEEVSALPVSRLILPRRLGDPSILVCDGEYARKKLHWSPQRGLIEILRTAWKWQVASQLDAQLASRVRCPSPDTRVWAPPLRPGYAPYGRSPAHSR
jgi:UDP-glucose 4-epimerase